MVECRRQPAVEGRREETMRGGIGGVVVLAAAGLGLGVPARGEVNLEKEKAAMMRTDQEFSDAAQKIGVGEAFVRYADAGATMLPPGEHAVTGLDGVRKQFADAGVIIWGTGTVCEFHSPDPKVVEQHIETCKQFLQLTADLGGKGVKVRPNGLPKEVPVEKTLEQIGRLFTEEQNAIEVLKWKEIFDLLERATDECEDVANEIEGLVVKYT